MPRAKTFERFGTFLLMDRISSGAVAEVHLARPAFSAANGRLFVVKRILPASMSDPQFIELFKSEIRLCMALNHPNIIQLFDFGEFDRCPYLSMEYVQGKNLDEIMARFAELDQPIPVGLSVTIIAQAAAALHYAHTFRSTVTGEALNIVHRNVSPRNLLVSYNGNLKIVDFGISRTSDAISKTLTGLAEAEGSYLSPEQARGEDLDGRTDVFSLGVVLWELLAGRRLFDRESPLRSLDRIENCDRVEPPSLHNAAVPMGLDQIVLKALRRSLDQRFQSAEDFHKALSDFHAAMFPGFTSADVSAAIRPMFAESIAEELRSLRRLNQQAQRELEERELESADAPVATTDPLLSVGPSPEAELTREDLAVFDSMEVPELDPAVRLASERESAIPEFLATPEASGSVSLISQSKFSHPGSVEIELDFERPKPVPKLIALAPAPPRAMTLPAKPVHKAVIDFDFAEDPSVRARSRVLKILGGLVASLLLGFWGFRSGGAPAPSSAVSTYEEVKAQVPVQGPMTPASQNVRPVAMRAPSSVARFAPGAALLRIQVASRARGIPKVYVDGVRLRSPNQAVKVPLDRRISVRIEQESHRPYHRQFILKSSDSRPGTPFQLKVKLTRR